LVLLGGPENPVWDEAVVHLQDPFLQQFAAFRSDRLTAARLLDGPSPQGRLLAVTWRLQKDVATQPHRRREIARLLLTWHDRLRQESAASPEASAAARPTSLATLRWLVWDGRLDEATGKLGSIAEPRAVGLATIASALSDSPEAVDQTRAANVWEEVADGLPQSSAHWLQVKTLALEAAYRGTHRDRATAAARYLLLTQPPDAPAIKQRLERLLR